MSKMPLLAMNTIINHEDVSKNEKRKTSIDNLASAGPSISSGENTSAKTNVNYNCTHVTEDDYALRKELGQRRHERQSTERGRKVDYGSRTRGKRTGHTRRGRHFSPGYSVLYPSKKRVFRYVTPGEKYASAVGDGDKYA